MAKKSPSTFHVGTFVVLIICLAIPLIASWFVVQYLTSGFFYQQQRDHLISVANMLDTQLGEGGYDALLEEAGAEEASRDEQIAILNDALEEATDKVASVAEGLGVGFYSKDLDAILTYGPSSEFEDTIGAPIAEDHPGREVMTTDTPMVSQGTMVRGNIMNAMIPVERKGEVIGYIWANELVSDLENTLNSTTVVLTILLVLAYLIMGAIVVIFFRRLMRVERKARESVEEASQETQRVDKLMHIVNNAVSSLLSADESGFKSALDNCMEMMATAFEVDRLIIWKREETQDTESHEDKVAFQLEALHLGEVGGTYNNIDFSSELPAVADWGAWLEKMEANQSVTRFISTEGDEGATWLANFGIKSITTIPVFLEEEFWGFVSFCNCKEERSFTENEEEILFSGSLLMANAIARNEMLQRLMIAREEALAGTQAKSAFLSSMSHEMRTPLSAIIGMTSIAESSDNVGQKDYCLGKIDEASKHLLGVINDILDISKIEADKFELSEEEFNFEQMLQVVVSVIGFRVDSRGQKFLVSVDEDIPRFFVGDDQRIAQVVTNLLGNASKFTPEGGTIALDAKLLNREGDLCTLEIAVKDNGIGIDSDKQAKLFQSFTQEDSSTVRKYGGTGLGLSISKRIVEMMDGTIWVESEKGQGSVFAFTVRLKIGSQEADTSRLGTVPWESLRVLVVDDDTRQLQYFKKLASQIGIGALYRAQSGEAACETIKEEGAFDLYFIDWNMHDTSGARAVECIKALEPEPRIVIMISAAELSRVQGEARRVGAKTFLEKPLFASNLAHCVIECMEDERIGQVAGEDTLDSLEGHRILLAEDVDINREIVLTLLEPTGLKIECAENGAQAVEMFKADPERYEMIFMDIHMPEMDGYEATRQIRMLSGAWSREVPIVAMTANVFREDVEKCLAAGMNDHIGKPLNMDDVMTKLRQNLC